METGNNSLSPQFKYIEHEKFHELEEYNQHMLRVLDDCVLSVFHRDEQGDEINMLLGELVALKNVRRIILENRNWAHDKAEQNCIDDTLKDKIRAYLLQFDENAVEPMPHTDDEKRDRIPLTKPL